MSFLIMGTGRHTCTLKAFANWSLAWAEDMSDRYGADCSRLEGMCRMAERTAMVLAR